MEFTIIHIIDKIIIKFNKSRRMDRIFRKKVIKIIEIIL